MIIGYRSDLVYDVYSRVLFFRNNYIYGVNASSVFCLFGQNQARTPDPAVASTVIVTRDMHEKANQPEKKRRSFWDRLKRRARDRKTKTKVLNRGRFEGEAGMAEVPGVTGEAREIPYLMQYRTKKDLERVLNDERYFNTPEDKLTAETIFVSAFVFSFAG